MSTEEQVDLEMRFLRSDSSPCQLPKRYIVTILGFFGMINVYALRMNMSVAIVAMVNTSSSLPENNTFVYAECPSEDRREETITESESKADRYDWDSITQNQIMSAFFYGYFITIPIGGYLAERFGGHRIFGAGIFLTSLLTLLTPLSVQWGLVPLIALRAMEGLCEGVTFPAMASVVGKWAPKMERSTMHSIIFSGTLIGNVVAYSVCGWLCSIDFLGGWPAAFYVFGVIGCAWYVLWYFFVYESPFKHPYITSKEFELFQDSVKVSKKQLRVPWLSIFTSIPFWAMVTAFMGFFFVDTITFTELPTYLSSVLNVDVKNSGVYSAFPSIALCIGSYGSSYVADRLRKRGILEITSIRKIFNSLAGYGLALCFVIVPFCGCQAWLVVVIFSLGMFVSGFKFAGFQLSSVDMSPTYSGILYGIANGSGALFGVIAPAMVGALTESGPTIANWSKAYYIAAAILTVATTIFALFSSAEVQPWDKPTVKWNQKEQKL